MESENVHHQQQHQLQDQLVVGSSSLPIPSCYAVASSSFTLNGSEFNPNYNGAAILNYSRQKNVDNITNSMIQDWSSSTNNEIKEEEQQQLSESVTRFSDEMLSDTTSSSSSRDLHDLSHKLLLKTISSGFPMFSSAAAELYQNYSIPSAAATTGNFPSRGNFSQIYPSINISNLNHQLASSSPNIIPTSSFDMNLEALDLLSSARFSRNNSFSSSPSFGIHHHHHFHDQSNQRATYSHPSKPFVGDITEAKRPSALPAPEPKATAGATAKKSRLESSRASCPPFKVRKEKLGDRIAALQQLVAPFGKTDTASVLMEAIGYIKFLQNQVETLSVPYMKGCRNKTCRTKQGGSTMQEDGNEEARRDLRSRGLCLVPLSCMSYMTNDGGGGIWPPPPNFTG